MKQYLVKPVTTGFFSGSLSERKLQDFLNEHGFQGWRFVRSIHETKKVWGLFTREAHFVVFEKDIGSQASPWLPSSDSSSIMREILDHLRNDPTPHLLRQLLRTYQIEPEA
ncbi:MAG: protein of unknown function DUF4177 [Verrucomicrobia bacterium]|nr:MAG: protein of unknown function DUF4177 [Verrucomicrobiota bacterium]